MEARATSFGKVLEVLGETPVASEPGESSRDNPAAREDNEALHVVAPLGKRVTFEQPSSGTPCACQTKINCFSTPPIRHYPTAPPMMTSTGYETTSISSRCNSLGCRRVMRSGAAMLGMLGGAVAAVTLIEALSRSCL
jgi:hypothetical protein